MKPGSGGGLKPASVMAGLAVLVAGCVNGPGGPTPTDGSSPGTPDSQNPFWVGAQPVASISATVGAEATEVVLTGFAHFGIYSPAVAELFPPETVGNITERLETKLSSVLTQSHTLGFLLDENFISALGKSGQPKFGFVRENGALVVIPGSPPSDGISYMRVEGQAYDLFAFIGENTPDGVQSLPLVVVRSSQTLEPNEYTLDQLYRNFTAIIGNGLVAHVQTHGIAFGTTKDHAEGSSSAVDVGLYEVFAPYYTPPNQVTTVRVGMGAVWIGTGEEYLGQDVTIDAFLVNETALGDLAKSRSVGLADEAQNLLPQVPQAGTLKSPWTQNLENQRIPGFLLAYKVTPTDYHHPPGLSDLYASKPGPQQEATAPVRTTPADSFAGNFENRIVGAGLKEICLALTGGACQSPYDLGIYVLATFVWDGSSENFTVYAIPVLYPIKGTAPPFTGERVRVDAVYSKYDVARSVLSEKAHLRFDSKPWGRTILALLDEPARYDGFVDLKVLDGFLWANSIRVVPPTTPLAPVLLLPPKSFDVTSSSVALSWFWPHESQTIPDYHVYASTNPFFVPSQVNQKEGDLTQESYTVGGLSSGKWYFKIRAYAGASVAPSNRVWATVGSSGSPTPPPSPTLYPITPCADDRKHCLRIDWSRYEGADFQHYEVYRSVSGGTWSLHLTITNSDGDEVQDEGLTCGTYYSYYVRLVTTGGSSNSESRGETTLGPPGYC